MAEVDHPLWRLRDVPVAKCQSKLDEHLAHLRSRLSDTLKPDQVRRFDQLLLQARGIKGVGLSGSRRQFAAD